MEKLIITATTANSWIYPDLKNWAGNDKDLVEDAVKCAEAGAAVIHIHLPRGREVDVVKRLRDRTEALVQAGMSSEPIPDRKGDFTARPDMMSVILNHHAEQFTEVEVNRLHPVSELEEYCKRCRDSGIKPEWEVWNSGSYWNLRYLRDKGLLDPPSILTLFFGWPGGTWSPSTTGGVSSSRPHHPGRLPLCHQRHGGGADPYRDIVNRQGGERSGGNRRLAFLETWRQSQEQRRDHNTDGRSGSRNRA